MADGNAKGPPHRGRSEQSRRALEFLVRGAGGGRTAPVRGEMSFDKKRIPYLE